MTNRSTVTRLAGCDVNSAYQAETPPESPNVEMSMRLRWSVVGSGTPTSQEQCDLNLSVTIFCDYFRYKKLSPEARLYDHDTPNPISAGALPQTPLWELTTLSHSR